MKKKFRNLSIVFCILFAAVGIWRVTNRSSGSGSLIVKAKKGEFIAELLQIGEVKAVKSINISPSSWGKIAELVSEGEVVIKDQPIAWLEAEDLERNVEKTRVDLKLSRKRLLKAEETALLQKQLKELTVQEARATLQYQKNQLVSSQSKLEKTRRLVEADISPKKALEDAELNVLSQELQVQNSQLSLEKALKNQVSQIKLQEADVTSAKIDVEKILVEFERVEDNLANAVIKAPESGMVLYKMIWKGGQREKVAVGDQVGPWQAFLEIPDLSKLEVMTKVDEIDISRLAEGQKATISLDAFPDMMLTGEVTKIASLAQNAGGSGKSMGRFGGSEGTSGRKVFEIHISINETPADLRPGVTGRVRIVLSEQEDSIYVPIESVYSDSDGRFVYVDSFGGPIKQKVETGAWNYQYISITKGLEAGDKVWLVRPE
ncbi:efflux RND transporter periplasmic adaptor subunit [bacterium]|nr:efflux RND transporter periplasmic adaptor subunit [bacterium]